MGKKNTNESVEEIIEEVVEKEVTLLIDENNVLLEKDKQIDEYKDKLMRSIAEFDNYKKRVIKEREANMLDTVANTIKEMLPVFDNIERALTTTECMEDNPLKAGMDLVLRQFKEVLIKLGIEEIEAIGKEFDPNLHYAVSHMEDDELGANIIVEEMQKGYKIKEKVIRYSMVKVAN